MDYSIVLISLGLLLQLFMLVYKPLRVAKGGRELMDKHLHYEYLKRYSAYRMNIYVDYKD